HSDAFWYRSTGATTALDPLTQTFVPASKWNLFGGSVGGPIRKDKTFFFGDYEGARRVLGGSVGVRVPTEAERGGDLSDLFAASSGNEIFDPFDATGNVIAPASRSQFMSSSNHAYANLTAVCTNAAVCPNMVT